MEKEKTLSEKREEMFDTWNRVSEGIPNRLIEEVKEKDIKEFISRTIEDLNFRIGHPLNKGIPSMELERFKKFFIKRAGEELK